MTSSSSARECTTFGCPLVKRKYEAITQRSRLLCVKEWSLGFFGRQYLAKNGDECFRHIVDYSLLVNGYAAGQLFNIDRIQNFKERVMVEMVYE
jgi:hypothetical protein